MSSQQDTGTEPEENRVLKRAIALIDERADELAETDREALHEFKDKIIRENARKNNRAPGRQAVLLNKNRVIAQDTGRLAEAIRDDEIGEDAVDDIVGTLTDSDRYSGNSMLTGLSAFRQFGRLMTDGDGLPDRFADIKPDSHRDRNPAPARSEVLHWEHIVQLAEAREGARSEARDQAIIAVQWSAMTRPWAELWPLRFKDVEDNGDHMILSVPNDAKTGRRDVYIFAGAPLLRRWMYHEHPAHLESEPGPNPETPLWTKWNTNEQIGEPAFSQTFKRALDESEVTRPATARHCRRSRASVLASRPTIDEQDLRALGGWSFDSSAPKHYIATFSKETANNVAAADGAEFDAYEEPAPIAPLECEDCGKYTERHFEECIWCSATLPEEDDARVQLNMGTESSTVDMLELVADGDVTADQLRAIHDLEDHIRSREAFFEEIPHLVQLAEAHEGDDSASTAHASTPAGMLAWASDAVAAGVSDALHAQHVLLSLSSDWKHYPPSPLRAVGTAAAAVASTVVLSFLFLADGFLQDLAAGDPAGVGPAVIAMLLAGAFIAYDLPSTKDVDLSPAV